ncbi:hypothetical protein [uncultured Rhodoblastus sp.]|uniref:hypothetical protein n=1 Tax=uncultured Rhodoblastus sp. TaxID=543037 RepID=UPI0025F7E648|nr:hypothetical protein [uncultured Rhodoblastus sp.]
MTDETEILLSAEGWLRAGVGVALATVVERRRGLTTRETAGPRGRCRFCAWQARRNKGPNLPIERYDGKYSSTKKFIGFMFENLRSGDRTCETPKS